MKSMEPVQDPVSVTQPTSHRYKKEDHVLEKENHDEKNAFEDPSIIPEHSTTSKFSADEHETKFHKVSNGKNISILHFDPSKTQKRFICSVCHEGFNTRTLLSMHIQIHVGEETCRPVSDQQLNLNLEGTQDVQLNTHSESRKFSCPVCKEAFVSLQAFQSHMKTKDGFFKCCECGKILRHEYMIKRHMRIIHLWGKPHHCPICDKKLNTKYRLNTHMETHTERSYRCYEKFTKKNRYYSHIRSHHVQSAIKTFECSVCCTIFNTKYKLNIHMKIHDGVKLYQCSECDKTFDRSIDLSKHVRIHTTTYIVGELPCPKEGKRHTCSFCSKTWNARCDLIKHERTHTGEKPFKCSVCLKSFTTNSSLYRHRKKSPHKECSKASTSTVPETRHGKMLHFQKAKKDSRGCPSEKEQKPYRCSYCSKTWKTNYDLTKHLRIHTGEKPFKCSVCFKTFTTNSSLYRHRRKSPNQECSKTSTSTVPERRHVQKPEREVPPLQKNEQPPYNRSFCVIPCKKHYDLIKHKKTHTGEKPFECSDCLKVFTTNSSMDRHTKTHHNSEPCKKSTVPVEGTMKTLHIHSSKEDTGEFLSEKKQKLHRCSFCSKTWKSNSDLIKHLRTHTGEKPFECFVCFNVYVSSSSLYRHMKVIHNYEYSKTQKAKNDAREFPLQKEKNPLYNYSFCGITWKRNCDLIKCERTHTGEKPFECTMCLKVFPTSSNMNRHMKTYHNHDHSKNSTSTVPMKGTLNDKRRKGCHACNICLKSFHSSYYLLKYHVRIHTNKKLYTYNCFLCSKTFVTEGVLGKHLKHHDKMFSKNEESFRNDSVASDMIRDAGFHTVSDLHKSSSFHSEILSDVGDNGTHKTIHIERRSSIEIFDNTNLVQKDSNSDNGMEGNIECDRPGGDTLGSCTISSDAEIKQEPEFECDNLLSVDENLESEKTFNIGNVSKMCCETDCTKCDCVEHLLKKKEKENSSSSPVLNDSDGLDAQSTAQVVSNSSEIYVRTSSNSNAERKDIANEIMNLELECESVIDEECDIDIEKQSEDDSYECSFCQKTFMNENCLQQHIQTHTEENSYKCSECDETFAGVCDCHLKVHTGDKCYKCPQCPKSFQEKHDFGVHAKVNSGEKPYQCSICDMRFGSSRGLHNHKRRKHKGVCAFQCSICEEKFHWNRNRMFIQHFKQHNESFTEVRPYKCSKCSLTYFTVKGVQRHTRSHSGVKKIFKCFLCSKPFKRRHDLDCHVRTHTGEKPYQCSICGRMCRQSSQLYRHMRLHKNNNSRVSGALNHIDSGEKQHKCKECFESFHEEHDLDVHMKIHTGEKSYICSICGDTFCKSSGLDKHSLENYKADHISSVNCSSQIVTDPSRTSDNSNGPEAQKTIFMDSGISSKALDDSDLLRDRNIKVKKSKGRVIHENGQEIILETSLDQGNNTDESHNRVKDSSHKCSLSSQTSTTETFLQHSKTHTTKNDYSYFKWDGTGAPTSENSLNRHLKIHSNEKCHKCLDCSKSFKDKHDLIVHMRSHTGEKPYQCLKCNKYFSQNSNLKRHMKLHNADIEESRRILRTNEIGRKRISESVDDDALLSSNTFDVGDYMESDDGESSYQWEKQYKCSECSKSFHTNYDLVVHIRTHTGEKPFQCSKCDKTFRQNSHLYRHIRLHEKYDIMAKYLV